MFMMFKDCLCFYVHIYLAAVPASEALLHTARPNITNSCLQLAHLKSITHCSPLTVDRLPSKGDSALVLSHFRGIH